MMTFASRVFRKVDDILIPWLASDRRTMLARTNFSIISNNCWAGSVYRYYGLPYLSPTAGLYFFADDYVKFAGNLRHYLSAQLESISLEESRHKDQLILKKQMSIPLGKLDDIEIVFLHYPTFKEAKDKWGRRVNRINWNNLFIKFSEMNGCAERDLLAFDEIPHQNKICFTVDGNPNIECGIIFPGYEKT